MDYLDWIVIVIYFIGLVGFAGYCASRQRDTRDYYLAAQKIKWWQSGTSTMATQLSAVSFISAPAFVAVKTGGGLKWLAYEFAVPLALILVMAVIVPVLHKKGDISIYAYLEERFDAGVRTMVSIFFQLGRGLATAVVVLAGGLILSTAFSISTVSAILLIGIITLAYDMLGGIRVVIFSDILQMAVILIGLIVCVSVAWHLVGWDTAWSLLPADRCRILHFGEWGLSSKSTYGFWPMLFGGFFLYVSYYGTDQSQVQRELTVGTTDDAKKSLMVNALGRFPIVLLYCVMGVFVGAVFTMPEQISHIADSLHSEPSSVSRLLHQDPDRMVPMFIMSFLPHGVIGFMIVAIMAALMSSIDSGLNSLSAVTMKDIYQRYIQKNASAHHYVVASKVMTLLWGIFCVVFALLLNGTAEATRQTSIVVINAVGSMLYGPVLAAFLIGMFSTNIGANAVRCALVVGLLSNIVVWLCTSLSWLWWNVSGCMVSVITAFAYSGIASRSRNVLRERDAAAALKEKSKINWPALYVAVLLYFFIILLVACTIERAGR